MKQFFYEGQRVCITTGMFKGQFATVKKVADDMVYITRDEEQNFMVQMDGHPWLKGALKIINQRYRTIDDE